MHGTFFQVALLLLVCALVGALFVRLRQPVLIAYIVVGIAAGPAVFGFIEASDAIDLLAQIGVTVLLFLVGLKLDLKHIRHIGPVALATGLGQLAFTICIGFVLTLALGKGWVEALYVAVALTFSSTIIIVKLLSDKRELDSLHGRIAVGFLIVQDLAVVLAMMAMSALREPAADGPAAGLGAWYVPLSLGLRLAAAGGLIFVLMRWVLPRVVAAMARSQELLGLFAIAWGIALAACGEWAGFSKEAGAFLAGFSLASTPFRAALGARLSGIRDFLLLFFFIDLGAKLELGSLGAELWPALVLSLFVLIGNPLIVMTIMGVMGYRRRTGFMAGLTVAQISEFSIVFVAMGITLGHVGSSALGLTTLVGLITITLSTYMILYAQPLYERLAPALRVFERRHPFRELEGTPASGSGTPAADRAQVLLFGVGRHGARMLRKLQQAGASVAGVDFDPDNVAMLRASGLEIYFGDSEDPDFLDTLPLAQVQWAISALPLADATSGWLHALRAAGYRGRVGVVVRDAVHARALRHEAVDWVMNPFEAAADHAAQELVRRLARPLGAAATTGADTDASAGISSPALPAGRPRPGLSNPEPP